MSSGICANHQIITRSLSEKENEKDSTVHLPQLPTTGVPSLSTIPSHHEERDVTPSEDIHISNYPTPPSRKSSVQSDTNRKSVSSEDGHVTSGEIAVLQDLSHKHAAPKPEVVEEKPPKPPSPKPEKKKRKREKKTREGGLSESNLLCGTLFSLMSNSCFLQSNILDVVLWMFSVYGILHYLYSPTSICRNAS